MLLVLVLLGLVHLTLVKSDCCSPDGNGLCGDGTAGTPCCGYGGCDIFCCNCDGGCRRWTCKYQFDSSAIVTVIQKEEKVSNALYCDEGNIECSHDLSITKSFSYSYNIGTSLDVTLTLGAIASTLSNSFGETWSYKTAVGSTYSCTVSPGKLVWITVAPKHVNIEGYAKEVCCSGGSSCYVKSEGYAKSSYPIVDANNNVVGDYHCWTSDVASFLEKLTDNRVFNSFNATVLSQTKPTFIHNGTMPKIYTTEVHPSVETTTPYTKRTIKQKAKEL